jgi:hypothetical protein
LLQQNSNLDPLIQLLLLNNNNNNNNNNNAATDQSIANVIELQSLLGSLNNEEVSSFGGADSGKEQQIFRKRRQL